MDTYDVVTLGETMLRFTPPGFRRLSQTTSLEIHVGGSESNTAVGLARLGLRVCWVSRLTDNILGHYIAEAVARQGVASHVVWTSEDRVGTYFMEEGRPPRNSRVLYDRKNSAMSHMRPEHLPADLFQPGKARLLHMTGITPALGEEAALTVSQALNLAKQAGWLVSFDVNYRANLWSPAQCRAALDALLPQVDILFSPLGDAIRIFDAPANPADTLNLFRSMYPQALIALTIGKDGAAACDRDGHHYRHPVFPAEQVDRLGGGDAFSAGFLYGYLTTANIDTALRWGSAVAALKYTIPGDFPLIDYDDALKLVEGDGTPSGNISR